MRYFDPDGRAPRNLSASNRTAYINKVSTYSEYTRTSNTLGIPDSYDCADVAAYIYGEAISTTTSKASIKDLTANGNPLIDIAAISSTDFFPGNNVDFYKDKSFNNKNIEIGSIMVWKGPGGNQWRGHIATVVGIEQDKKGNITNIKIIQGHTRGGRTEVVNIPNQKDLDSYAGDFLGFGEIGKNSTHGIIRNFLDNTWQKLKLFLKGNQNE